MSEQRQITTLVAITLAIGILAAIAVFLLPPLFEGNLVVDRYSAALAPDGTLTETYTYDVKAANTYRMLYRTWEVPLSFGFLDQPSVEFVGMDPPAGTIGYAKDDAGRIWTSDQPAGSPVPGGGSALGDLQYLAQPNEVGIANPSYFPAGTYTVRYTFLLHPPIEYDPESSHLNLRLADAHVPYRIVSLTFPSDGVKKVYPYPPFLSAVRQDSTYQITGTAGSDEVLGYEIVATRAYTDGIRGFPNAVADVQGQTAWASWIWSIPYYIGVLLLGLGMLLALGIPFLLYLVWRRYGQEAAAVAPEYLSVIPDRMVPPWVVNLVFRGDALDFDANGLYATILDLHRRKILQIRETGEEAPKPAGGVLAGISSLGKDRAPDLEIRVLKTTVNDPYEQRVINFLRNTGHGDVVRTGSFQAMANAAQTDRLKEAEVLRLKASLDGLTTQPDRAVASRFVIDGRPRVVPLLLGSAIVAGIAILVLVLVSQAGSLLIPAVFLGIAAVIECAVAWAFPSTLFGRWKDNYYQEKLQWDAFTRFLSDLALMRQYAPADLSMWGEWLVYGTALGVGD
ncbi:MAG: DUF2207 domain-containing protein, partial [Methanomicrobiales archaeon]|nr:DUF2207 domain-containing protein [Methanomicrobiales archaeon]